MSESACERVLCLCEHPSPLASLQREVQGDLPEVVRDLAVLFREFHQALFEFILPFVGRARADAAGHGVLVRA